MVVSFHRLNTSAHRAPNFVCPPARPPAISVVIGCNRHLPNSPAGREAHRMALPSASRLLAGSFILLQAVDFCLTQLLLGGARADVYEANPLAMRILHAHGWSGLALFKLLCTF